MPQTAHFLNRPDHDRGAAPPAHRHADRADAPDRIAAPPADHRPQLSLADEARRLARHGWAVFRVKPRDKRPLRPGWQNEASADPEAVAALWHEDPRANIGLPTGRGFWVLDVDGEAGRRSLGALVERHGRLPPTPAARTGSGGWHLFLALPAGVVIRNSAGRLGPGLDTRGTGGYVVAAPSIHPSGSRYQWVAGREPWAVPLADPPAWLLDLVAAPRGPSPGAVPPPTRRLGRPPPRSGTGGPRYALAALWREAEAVRTAPAGTRNDTLNRAAYALGRLVAAGQLAPALVGYELGRAAAAAGLDPREIAATLRSALTARLGGRP